MHITALHNDYYHFDPAGHRLRGERTGKQYRLGDEVRVKVVRVNLDDRKIDFGLPDAGQDGAPRPGGKKSGKRGKQRDDKPSASGKRGRKPRNKRRSRRKSS